MVTGIVLYFLQSAICMAFFYALYWLFLKRDTFFRINRLFLLLTLAASLLIPSLDIPFQPEPNPVSSEIPMLDAVVLTSQQYLSVNMLEEVVVTAHQHINWYQYIGFIYLIGFLMLALRFFKNLIQLLIWSRTNQRIHNNGIRLVVMDDDYPPFSFLNVVFISRKDYSNDRFSSILEHERVHVDQLHTFDLLLLEILTVFFWMNPFVWLFKSSIQEVHEYLADDKVVNQIPNPNEYKMHIVNQFAGGELFRLANNFGQSTLKKRISMLGKIKTPKIALIKLLLLIPIFVVLFSAFSFTIEEKEKIDGNISIKDFIPDEISNLYSVARFNKNYEADNQLKFVKGGAIKGINSLEYKQSVNPNEVYRIVEVMPEFPGGTIALQNYIANAISYPKQAQKNGIYGRVFVSFVVGKQGEIKNANIVRGVNPLLDQEAIRVIKSLPKWNPGKNNGNYVNVAYTVPINFQLGKNQVEPIAARSSELKRLKNASDYLDDELIKIKKEAESYLTVEKMPQFPGGTEGLRRFIAREVKYPVLAAEQGYEGRVYVRFIVNKDGRISNAHIIKGANIELNKEAIRVINSMPAWVPGEQHGTKVKVSFTIPIRFALN